MLKGKQETKKGRAMGHFDIMNINNLTVIENFQKGIEEKLRMMQECGSGRDVEQMWKTIKHYSQVFAKKP